MATGRGGGKRIKKEIPPEFRNKIYDVLVLSFSELSLLDQARQMCKDVLDALMTKCAEPS